MGFFVNTGLDPNYTATTDIWPSTLAELKRRELEIHGSLSRRNVDDGATAVVLKATETRSGRVVAIKVYKDPHQHVLHRNGDTIAMTDFFENERRMMAGLQACPEVPKYYYSVEGGSALTGDAIQPFHVMEFVEGDRITKFATESVKDNRNELIQLFQDVLRAVESIHTFGYLHRDISDGNVLVDREGKIRLIDLAEASPLGEEHTRLVTTPGRGTEGVATTQQQVVRKIQTDDVNAACTIGYALFTGRWKARSEDASDWQRNLRLAGAPEAVARILTKGMKARDTNKRRDESVWNTANEVDKAIDGFLSRRRARKRAICALAYFAVTTAFVLAVGTYARDRIRRQAYLADLRQLNDQRIELGENPHRVDDRVRAHVEKAETLEAEAEQASREGRIAESAKLLRQSSEEIDEAAELADDLRHLAPQLKTLQAMLNENDQWNTDCPFIAERIAHLQERYLNIKRQVNTGDMREARRTIADIHQQLVSLISDNQQSHHIVAQIQQFDNACLGLAPILTKKERYQEAVRQRKEVETKYFAKGKWPEARIAMLAHQQSLDLFLKTNETEKQEEARLASNADMARKQLAANVALQLQLESLSSEVAEKQHEIDRLDAKNNDILIAAAQDRTSREEASKLVAELRTQIDGAQSKLQIQIRALEAATAERNQLAEQAKKDQAMLSDYESRLRQGSAAWRKQSSELADVRGELEIAERALQRSASAPRTGAEEPKIRLTEHSPSAARANAEPNGSPPGAKRNERSNPFEQVRTPQANMSDAEVQTALWPYRRALSEGELAVALNLQDASRDDMLSVARQYILMKDTIAIEIRPDGAYKLMGNLPKQTLICELESLDHWHPNWRSAAIHMMGSIPDLKDRTMFIVMTPKTELAIYRALAAQMLTGPPRGSEFLVEARPDKDGQVVFRYIKTRIRDRG